MPHDLGAEKKRYLYFGCCLFVIAIDYAETNRSKLVSLATIAEGFTLAVA